MCGEYIALRFTVGMYLGSPPHTWRIQYPALSTAEPLRITSTYVENTNFLAMYQMDYQGSPPHTWRILSKSKSGKHHRLITSTYVENTRNVESLVNALKDHLHTRGEYAFFLYHTHNTLGSLDLKYFYKDKLPKIFNKQHQIFIDHYFNEDYPFID